MLLLVLDAADLALLLHLVGAFATLLSDLLGFEVARFGIGPRRSCGWRRWCLTKAFSHIAARFRLRRQRWFKATDAGVVDVNPFVDVAPDQLLAGGEEDVVARGRGVEEVGYVDALTA